MTHTWLDLLQNSPYVTPEEIQEVSSWADVQKLLAAHTAGLRTNPTDAETDPLATNVSAATTQT